MRRVRRLGLIGTFVATMLTGLQGTASADAPPCPESMQLATLSELRAFVREAGGQAGQELTAFFEHIDENDDGLICFKTLPEATPFPTPPLLGHDNA